MKSNHFWIPQFFLAFYVFVFAAAAFSQSNYPIEVYSLGPRVGTISRSQGGMKHFQEDSKLISGEAGLLNVSSDAESFGVLRMVLRGGKSIRETRMDPVQGLSGSAELSHLMGSNCGLEAGILMDSGFALGNTTSAHLAMGPAGGFVCDQAMGSHWRSITQVIAHSHFGGEIGQKVAGDGDESTKSRWIARAGGEARQMISGEEGRWVAGLRVTGEGEKSDELTAWNAGLNLTLAGMGEAVTDVYRKVGLPIGISGSFDVKYRSEFNQKSPDKGKTKGLYLGVGVGGAF